MVRRIRRHVVSGCSFSPRRVCPRWHHQQARTAPGASVPPLNNIVGLPESSLRYDFTVSDAASAQFDAYENAFGELVLTQLQAQPIQILNNCTLLIVVQQ